jgi:acyl carrier protein
MSIFNKIEDVIDFQLTPYGRKKLRDGKFNPSYYAFGDSDILYDTRFVGISGSQNETYDNIDNTERTRLSTYPTNNLEKYRLYKDEFYMPSILGSSELGNNLYPAFEVKLYQGQISGSIQYLTSTFLNQKIPTLNVIMKCNFDNTVKDFISQEDLLLEITENNGLFTKENFDIYIYKKDENHDPVHLDFYEADSLDTAMIVNENEVLYWFHVDFDEEIEKQIEFINDNSSVYSQRENNNSSRDC